MYSGYVHSCIIDFPNLSVFFSNAHFVYYVKCVVNRLYEGGRFGGGGGERK